MTDILLLMPSFLVGILVGVFFFMGLWYTTKKLMDAKHPALWALGSMVVRVAVTLVSFYLVGAGDLRKLLACLVGFILSRIFVMRITATVDRKNSSSLKETEHETQS